MEDTKPLDPKQPVAERAPVYAGLRNSIWCHDKDGNLGMIAEAGSAALFYYENADGTALEEKGVLIPIEQLAQCRAADVPARLGLTPAQLTEMGYE